MQNCLKWQSVYSSPSHFGVWSPGTSVFKNHRFADDLAARGSTRFHPFRPTRSCLTPILPWGLHQPLLVDQGGLQIPQNFAEFHGNGKGDPHGFLSSQDKVSGFPLEPLQTPFRPSDSSCTNLSPTFSHKGDWWQRIACMLKYL